MLNFTLFGIPVRVQPFFWLIALLIALFVSGVLHRQPGPEMIFPTMIWIVMVFFSVLIHELGHALTGLKVGGGQAAIELHGLGGLAYNQGGRFDRTGRRWMIAMGPGAGFLFGLIGLLVMFLLYGVPNAIYLAGLIIAPKTWISIAGANLELISYYLNEKSGWIVMFKAWIWINFWWGILNLLPIHPLDGGQLLETFLKSPKLLHKIALIASIGAALFGMLIGQLFLMVIMGFLAYQNFQAMQEARY